MMSHFLQIGALDPSLVGWVQRHLLEDLLPCFPVPRQNHPTAEDPRHPRLSHVTLVPLRSGANDPGAWHVSGVQGQGRCKLCLRAVFTIHCGKK